RHASPGRALESQAARALLRRRKSGPHGGIALDGEAKASPRGTVCANGRDTRAVAWDLSLQIARRTTASRGSRDVAGILSSLEFRILRSGGGERRAGGPQRFPADVFTASPARDSSVCETSRPSRPARTGERGESQMTISCRLLV